MSRVGIGTYRLSDKSAEHEKALTYALESGVTLIETSSNYTGGGAEKLIGRVLKSNPRFAPFIISKFGYMESDTSEVSKLFPEDLVRLADDSFYSLHPDFIEHEIKKTLERLGVNCLDGYLLHNPEMCFKDDDVTIEEYYKRIGLAFEKCEELVDRGLIRHFGVSSNNFIKPRDHNEATDLETLCTLAIKIKDDNHFKYIQFPLNLIETEALERSYGGMHIIEKAQEYGLEVMTNRPLNAFSDHGLIRLGQREVENKYLDSSLADSLFNEGIKPLVIKWLEVREDEQDLLFDLPIMKQISSVWHQQNSEDAVDQVFMQYFFPLVAKIFGRDLSAEESQSFYDLYDHANQFARVNMSKRSKQFEEQAMDKGLLFESDLTLSQKVISKYQGFGVDTILVGMREKNHVDDLKQFF